jgi:hypothetical protein
MMIVTPSHFCSRHAVAETFYSLSTCRSLVYMMDDGKYRHKREIRSQTTVLTTR